MSKRLDTVALRAFLMSIRTAADAALHLLGSVQPPVQSSVQSPVQRQSNRPVQRPIDPVGLDLDGAVSSSEISSSLQDSEDLEEEREKREASPERAGLTAGLNIGLSAGLDSGLKPGQHVAAAALANCWDGIGGMGCNGGTRALMLERYPLIERLARERGIDPLVMFKGACDRFKADPSVSAKRLKTPRVLLDQLENWVDDAPALSASRAPAPPSTSPSRVVLNRAPSNGGDA